jgi:DUF1680 family protein
MSDERHDASLSIPPQRELTRRELLALFALAGTTVFGVRATAATAASVGESSPTVYPDRALPFDLADVRLTDGPFRDAQRRDAIYLLQLEPDRLLHNFRVNAGMSPKAPVYGGWESEEPWVDIRCHGHTLGHYLSAAAMMSAATGDSRFRERVNYIIGELAACQTASGAGLVCAFPDGSAQLEKAIAGQSFVGVPWYTMHKVLAGLRDAHLHAGSAKALDVLTRLSEWVATATQALNDEQFQRMLEREHGGMNEVLADVSVLTKDDRYLTLAKRFSHQALLEPLADGRDTLDGLHANTQIPKVVGFQRLYELTREARYGVAARFFWHAVTGQRSFVTGGHGDGEHYFPISEFAQHLQSAKTMETCCTHNMLRLTHDLFVAEPRAEYADYYERALYNGILASQDPESGMMTYFQATRPGYVKLFHTPTESFWCCTGTGMENHAKYGGAIYFHDAETLFVNLFIPSVLTWRARGMTITQRTRFPEENTTQLVVTTDQPTQAALQVRHPGWCEGMTVRVNGRKWQPQSAPGTYAAIEREWRNNDVVDVYLPMTLRTESLPGVPNVVAIMYGPIVLAGDCGNEGVVPGANIIKNERTSGSMLNATMEIPVLVGDPATLVRRIHRAADAPLKFRTQALARPRDVELVPYYQVARQRYALYWNLDAT